MKDNYAAWAVNERDFNALTSLNDRLQFLVNFAVLAPSSHNSQPWRFTVRGNSIYIEAEEARMLPKSDTNHRQLWISLGCALENLLIAGDYYNFKTTVEGLPAGAGMKIALEPQPPRKPDDTHLIFSIPKRHTNRNPYTTELPPSDFLAAVKSLATKGMRIDIVQDQQKKIAVADVVERALLAAMDSTGFREELSHYVKPNITKSKVGMPMFGFGMPTPPSLLAPFLVKHFNVNRLSKKKDEELLTKHTPLFVVISTETDTQEDWVKAGRIFERIALLAEKNNIKTAPMAAAIQIGEFYKELQTAAGIQFRPQVFFRMGYTKKQPPHSPRLTGKDVTFFE